MFISQAIINPSTPYQQTKQKFIMWHCVKRFNEINVSYVNTTTKNRK